MISQKYRYHRRNHIQYLYKKGKTVRSGDITLKYLSGQKHENFRVGVVVSKKVSKKAPTRNRIRRRIYEVIRELIPVIKPDTDLLISVFSEDLATTPAADLKEQINKLLTEAEILDV